MKLSTFIIYTLAVAFITTMAIVEARPNRIRRGVVMRRADKPKQEGVSSILTSGLLANLFKSSPSLSAAPKPKPEQEASSQILDNGNTLNNLFGGL
ncbi:hypothetical protein BDF19DRAFT_447321 [Syncephalis fuscata]|nr:hypothetical protein BDF19DRAFT_447321 [Syncephalis fuscata]